jgi:hypothetical protein
MSDNLVPLGEILANAKVIIQRNKFDPDGSCDIVIKFDRNSQLLPSPSAGDPAIETIIANGNLQAHSPVTTANTFKSNPTSFIISVTVDSKKPGTGGDKLYNELDALFSK